MAYAPFGEGYTGSSTWVQFTGAGNAWTVEVGQNQSGSLDDFLFRRYSPVQGRWISPDPAGISAVDVTNPQSWNRYAYVLNNPLAFLDPLGLEPCPADACVYGNVPDVQTYTVSPFAFNEPIHTGSKRCATDTCATIRSTPPLPRPKSAARVRCDNNLLAKTALAGFVGAKASVVNSAEYAVDQLQTVFNSKTFQTGAGASLATTLTSAGVTDAVATTAGAALSEVVIPIAAFALGGYTLHEGYAATQDYWKEHQHQCDNIP
jgi:RHS repeat-associated protein